MTVALAERAERAVPAATAVLHQVALAALAALVQLVEPAVLYLRLKPRRLLSAKLAKVPLVARVARAARVELARPYLAHRARPEKLLLPRLSVQPVERLHLRGSVP